MLESVAGEEANSSSNANNKDQGTTQEANIMIDQNAPPNPPDWWKESLSERVNPFL